MQSHSILISQNIFQYIGAKIGKDKEQSYKNDRIQIQKKYFICNNIDGQT